MSTLDDAYRAVAEIAEVCRLRIAVREAGFTDAALAFPRSRMGFIALCAWNGVDPVNAPLGWHYAPNKAALMAWERVVEALK